MHWVCTKGKAAVHSIQNVNLGYFVVWPIIGKIESQPYFGHCFKAETQIRKSMTQPLSTQYKLIIPMSLVISPTAIFPTIITTSQRFTLLQWNCKELTTEVVPPILDVVQLLELLAMVVPSDPLLQCLWLKVINSGYCYSCCS